MRSAIAPSTQGERAELLDFRARMYGPRSAFANAAWVRWMYDDAPGAGARPALWTYRGSDGAIEGEIGAIRTRLRAGDLEHDFAWSLDLMVSPAHRARGVGAVLPKIVQASAEIVGGTEVSEAAQKSFVRGGWVGLGNLARWARPVRGELARTRMPSHLAPLLAPAVGLAANAVSLVSRARAIGRKLAEISEFDERADHVWRTCAPRWPIVARRDRAWLAWRWTSCPERRGATAFMMTKNGDPHAWIVMRVEDERGLRAGHILDFFCAPEDLDALLALAVAELRARDVDVVYCALRVPGSSAALAANGFLRRDSGFALMTFAPASIDERTRALVASPDAWFVTTGDSDLDRRRDAATVYA